MPEVRCTNTQMTTNTIQVLRSYICKRPPRHVIPTEVLDAVSSVETEDDDEQSLDDPAEQFIDMGDHESELGSHRGEDEDEYSIVLDCR